MGSIFFISDTHLHHVNFLHFRNETGKLIRPFADVATMNEHIIERWNSVVKDGDKIYHLGDVSFRYGRELAEVMSRLRGKKRLLVGNHDRIKGTNLCDWFEKVELWRIFKDEQIICSHVPLHQEVFRHASVNVHGHMHENFLDDPQYINVCVERVSYVPVELSELAARAKEIARALKA